MPRLSGSGGLRLSFSVRGGPYIIFITARKATSTLIQFYAITIYIQPRKATKIIIAALFKDTHTQKSEKLTVNTVYQTQVTTTGATRQTGTKTTEA